MQEHTTRAPRTTTTPIDRFWKYLDAGALSNCWEWMGALRNGYGVMSIGGKVVYTHRFSYELHYGPLAPGVQALHKCDNRKCCNPYHLFAGTHADNMKDMYAKGRGTGGAKKGCKPVVLTEDDVLEIRRLVAEGVRYPVLSEQFGVTTSNISMIVTRKRWKHLP